MKIPENAIIPDPKLTKYLLVFKQRNDKSQYLAQGGFYLENWQDLKKAIQNLIEENEAIEEQTDEYGTYYQVIGELQGIGDRKLSVVTIWLKRTIDDKFYFITSNPIENKNMNLELYQEIALTCNLPETQLKQGDIATLIDFVPHPNNRETGCVLEIFNTIGESIKVVTVPISAIKPLTEKDILTTRPLIEMN
ncbi:DUF6883 domain-containing protein [Spirulina sp. 06S082]|uniref:DUF6883 domain-containing protein n=1 Tax=Spirulina sp. 06S082 TaxID=3110248 RepID=UPI002B1FC80B|nr:DUF6883 domain-containing protein [Spirulina sp. 06S082]MEA5467954.1 hypothetical protein [Spirulina sp. 06S082]